VATRQYKKGMIGLYIHQTRHDITGERWHQLFAWAHQSPDDPGNLPVLLHWKSDCQIHKRCLDIGEGTETDDMPSSTSLIFNLEFW
jgi:hypothetical protein